MPRRIPRKAKKGAKAFSREFKRHLVTGITAAFAFLIALTWREPIADSVNMVIVHFDIQQELLLKYISALVFTIIGALVLLFITWWAEKK